MQAASATKILLISCYELGHQPMGIASPAGFLKRAGYEPDVLDFSIDPINDEKILKANLIGISVPMHTALRLGIKLAERIREINPSAHICFYGLYASLNADYLLEHVADSIIGGESEQQLVELANAIQSGNDPSEVSGITTKSAKGVPQLVRLSFAAPDRTGLPAIESYARLEHK